MMMDSRVYGGSNMTLHGSSDALDALLISSSSPNFHGGSRSMVNFQEINGKKSDGSFYQPHNYDETCDGDMSYCFYQPEKKKRLTIDQVQFLERCFEIENKLEPDRKIQIARDLDLQPRQVAIWFQNRRARWKTKQLEKDYETLKASYNNLKVGYENLLKEREKLKSEAIFLKERQSQKENSEKQRTHLQFQKTEHGSVSAIEESDTLVFKQEDLSCGNSAVFDSDGSHYKDCDRSSNIFEPDQSELSHTEEEEEHHVNRNQFPLVCNYGFTVEDQGLWF